MVQYKSNNINVRPHLQKKSTDTVTEAALFNRKNTLTSNLLILEIKTALQRELNNISKILLYLTKYFGSSEKTFVQKGNMTIWRNTTFMFSFRKQKKKSVRLTQKKRYFHRYGLSCTQKLI